MRWSRIILWVAAVLVGILLVIQYINAAKYEDYGDLPRDKSAVRMVSLKSDGDTGAYVIVWMRGELGNLMNVNKNFFTLQPRTEEKLEFSVYIPNSAEFKYYYGKVVIFQIPKIW